MASSTNQTANFVAELCDRFTSIFQQIKDLKMTTQQIEEENQKIVELIGEEREKFKSTQEELEQKQLELQQRIV